MSATTTRSVYGFEVEIGNHNAAANHILTKPRPPVAFELPAEYYVITLHLTKAATERLKQAVLKGHQFNFETGETPPHVDLSKLHGIRNSRPSWMILKHGLWYQIAGQFALYEWIVAPPVEAFPYSEQLESGLHSSNNLQLLLNKIDDYRIDKGEEAINGN
ncbi:MAG: hypothetical protein HWE12_03560 [Oceanospirillaceae bacterium]|nr:hypothetical protein [Oceanospirillaceae bacterium]